MERVLGMSELLRSQQKVSREVAKRLDSELLESELPGTAPEAQNDDGLDSARPLRFQRDWGSKAKLARPFRISGCRLRAVQSAEPSQRGPRSADIVLQMQRQIPRSVRRPVLHLFEPVSVDSPIFKKHEEQN